MIWSFKFRVGLTLFATTSFYVRSVVDATAELGLEFAPILSASTTIGAIAAVFLPDRRYAYGCVASLFVAAFSLVLTFDLEPTALVVSSINLGCSSCLARVTGRQFALAIASCPEHWGSIRAYGSLGAAVACIAVALLPNAYVAMTIAALLIVCFVPEANTLQPRNAALSRNMSHLLGMVHPLRWVLVASVLIGVVAKPYETYAAKFLADTLPIGEAALALGILPEVFLLGILWHRMSQAQRKWQWALTPAAWAAVYTLLLVGGLVDGSITIKGVAICAGVLLQPANAVFLTTSAHAAASIAKEHGSSQPTEAQVLLNACVQMGNLFSALMLVLVSRWDSGVDTYTQVWGFSIVLCFIVLPIVARSSREAR